MPRRISLGVGFTDAGDAIGKPSGSLTDQVCCPKKLGYSSLFGSCACSHILLVAVRRTDPCISALICRDSFRIVRFCAFHLLQSVFEYIHLDGPINLLAARQYGHSSHEVCWLACTGFEPRRFGCMQQTWCISPQVSLLLHAMFVDMTPCMRACIMHGLVSIMAMHAHAQCCMRVAFIPVTCEHIAVCMQCMYSPIHVSKLGHNVPLVSVYGCPVPPWLSVPPCTPCNAAIPFLVCTAVSLMQPYAHISR